MKIICVDDERLVLELIVYMCRKHPQVSEADGFRKAEDALGYLRQNRADIALLDINLPDMSGIALAEKIKEINPDIAIIFLTGHSKYALQAHTLHVSGYLLKPVSDETLAAEIDYAIENISLRKEKNKSSEVFVRTFGNFDVLVNGKTISFSRSRSKELLAYLVDRRGSFVTRANAFSVLWENRLYDRPMQKQFDVVLRSLRSTLEKYGISDILELNKGNIRVVPERFDCDLYLYYDGDPDTVNNYRGEYMSEYEWANDTEAKLFKN